MHTFVSKQIRDNHHELARDKTLREMAVEISHFLKMGIIDQKYLDSWEFMINANNNYAERNGTVPVLTAGSVAEAIKLVLTEYVEEGE